MPSPFFLQAASQYAPMVGSEPFRPYNAFEGVPLLGDASALGLPANLLAGLYLPGMMGTLGMAPTVLLHDRNMADVLESRRMTETYRASIAEAARADRQTNLRTLAGFAALTGTPFGASQRREAEALVDSLAPVTPFLAELAPNFLDELGGVRGSAAVMARSFALAGRYRRDPVTGRLGMEGSAPGKLAAQVFGGLYDQGDPAALMGLSAGRLGGLFDELTRRGMVEAPAGTVDDRTRAVWATDPRAATLAATRGSPLGPLGEAAKLSPDELDKLRLDPAVADRLRGFDAEAVKRSLKSYAGVVSAMRDIFGDMGAPNAPMSQLMNGLEALTQGSLSKLQPGQVSDLVRRTHELSNTTGLGMDAVLMLQQHAASRAQQLGLDPVFAGQAAMGAMAWGGAYRASGAAAVPAWGKYSADQQMQLDLNLRVQAAASRASNQFGAAVRLSEAVGGFDANTAAGAYVRALQAGETEFVDPATKQARSVAMADGELSKLLTAGTVGGRSAGVTAATVSGFLGQREANQEPIYRFNLAGVSRRLQGREIRGMLATQLGDELRSRLGAVAGVSGDQAARAAGAISAGVVADLGAAAPEVLADPTRRDAALAASLQSRLAGTDVGTAVTASGVDETAFYRQLGESAWGRWEAAIPRGEYRGLGSTQNAFVQSSDATMRDQRRLDSDAASAARIRELLSPLGRGSLLRRAVTAIQGARDTDPQALQKVALEAIGGVPSKDVRAALQTQAGELARRIDAVKTQQAKAAAAAPGPGKDALLKSLQESEQALKAQVALGVDEEQRLGLDTGPTAAAADAAVHSGDVLDQLRRGDVLAPALRGYPTDAAALKSRHEAFGKYWTSDSGATFRDATRRAATDLEDLAADAVTSDEGLRRYGPEGLKRYEQVRDTGRQLTDLARTYAGGDLARLQAGDLSLDASADGQKQARTVMDRVAGLNARRRGLAEWYKDAATTPGLGWAGDTTAAARRLLKLPAGPLSAEQQTQLERASRDLQAIGSLKPDERAQVTRYRDALKRFEDRAGQAGTTTNAVRAFAQGGAAPVGVAGQDLAGLKVLLEALTPEEQAVTALAQGKPVAGAAGLAAALGTADKLAADPAALAARERERKGAGELLSDAFQALGATPAAGQVDRLMRQPLSREARADLVRLSEGQTYLRGLAAKVRAPVDDEAAVRGVSDLATEYNLAAAAPEAGGRRASRLTAFRQHYGLVGDEDFAKLESELRFQRDSGALGALAVRPGERGAEVARLLEKLEKGPGGEGGGEMKVSGKLTIAYEGHQGELSGTAMTTPTARA